MITTSSSLRPIALVVLDMAGTTVADAGLTEIAYTSALRALDVESGSETLRQMLGEVRKTMGEPVISVLLRLFDGDESRARAGLKSFDARYAEFADAGQIVAMPGAAHAIRALRESGIKVALSTGFSNSTRECIVAALGWQDIADAEIGPDDLDDLHEGAGNPVQVAAHATGVGDPRLIATVGDTAFDVECGRQAGASFVAGVLTGAHDAPTLQAAGATHLLPGAMSLPEFITAA